MPEAALLSKLKAGLSEWSDVQFGGWKTFRSAFVQQSIDALMKMGYKERAAAEAVMPWSRHNSLEVVPSITAGYAR